MSVSKNGRTVLIGEDDIDVCNYLETALKYQGYSVEVARDGHEVLSCLNGRQTPVSAVVLDVIMPRMDGLDALKEIRRSHPDLPVIVVSGAASPLNVVEAMKNGANDFIAKPLNPDDLRKALKVAFESKYAIPAALVDQAASTANNQFLLGTSSAMRKLQSMMGSVGWSEAPVLIQGETGVGKEVLARQLHSSSRRSKRDLLKLNCAALPSELVESELFGYERGAFTGAFQKKPGMFEMADGSTIFLDEIGDMDFKLQAKLLQVLQDKEFQRIGGKEVVKVDVRVIAATHRDLEAAIADSKFREDLYYRLNVITLRVPPLRERIEDLCALADFFVRKHTAQQELPARIPPTLLEAFLEYHWPGNVRELENMVRKFLILQDSRSVENEIRLKIAKSRSNYLGQDKVTTVSPAARIDVVVPLVDATDSSNGTNGHLNVTSEGGAPVFTQLAAAKREAERAAILSTLKSTNWNRRKAAVQLQIDYKALLYKMRVMSIKKPVGTVAHAQAVGAA